MPQQLVPVKSPLFWKGEGSPTKIDYRKKGYPYSDLSTGGPTSGWGGFLPFFGLPGSVHALPSPPEKKKYSFSIPKGLNIDLLLKSKPARGRE